MKKGRESTYLGISPGGGDIVGFVGVGHFAGTIGVSGELFDDGDGLGWKKGCDG